jgi:hypothetical protein
VAVAVSPFADFGLQNSGGNPTFFVEQLSGMGQNFWQIVVRLQTIGRMYPDNKPQHEWSLLKGLLPNMTAMLAPKSDTEDPFGGAVPIYERIEFADWFGARPLVADACRKIWGLRTALSEALNNVQREAREVNQHPLADSLQTFTTHLVALRDAVQSSRSPVRVLSQNKQQPQGQHAGDDLLTIQELAIVCSRASKTLRNLRVLPQPDVTGGGRGKEHKWSYARVKPILAATLRAELPDIGEVRKILSARIKMR